MVGLSIIILVLSVLCVALGAILGAARGSRRSILRIILIAGCIVGAYFLLDMATGYVFKIEINGETLENYIVSQMGEDAAKYADLITPLIVTILKVITYLVLFIALQIVSILLQVILYIFVRPHKDSNGITHKHGAIGFLIGIVQGVAVALVFAVCLGGIAKNVQKINDADIEEINLPKELDLKYSEYEKSFPGMLYTKAQDPLFNMIATYTDSEGKKYTLDGQVDAVVASIKLGKSMNSLSGVDFSNGIDATNKESIMNTLDNIAEILNDPNLSTEAKETINTVINTVLSELDLGVDVTIDVTQINFENEKELISDLVDLSSGETVDTGKLVTDLANSDIALALMQSADVEVELTAEQKASAEASLASVTDPEAKAAIKKMLGL